MKKIYICSPYAGDIVQNIANALDYSKWVYKKGFLPICTHCYLELATGLSEERGDRNKILKLGKEMVLLCDELWIFGDKLSKGMLEEISLAIRRKLTIKFILDFKENENNK